MKILSVDIGTTAMDESVEALPPSMVGWIAEVGSVIRPTSWDLAILWSR